MKQLRELSLMSNVEMTRWSVISRYQIWHPKIAQFIPTTWTTEKEFDIKEDAIAFISKELED